MNHLKKIMLAAAVFSFGICAAQPSYYDQQKPYRDAQNYHNQLQRAYAAPSSSTPAPSTYKPSTYASPSSPSSANTPSSRYAVDDGAVEALVAKWKRERDGPSAEERAATKRLNEQYAAQQNQVRQEKANNEARRIAFWSSEERRFMQIRQDEYDGILSKADQLEMNKDAFFCSWIEVPWENYGSAERMYELFLQDADTASYTRLLAMAWQVSNHPYAASVCYAKMLSRFPEHRTEIEERKLLALPYYFGARRPLLSKNVSLGYPESAYEDMGPEDKKALLQTFITLAAKYPEVAQKAAGRCRSHINPFVLYADENQQNKELAAKYYLMYLRSDNSTNPVPKYGAKAHTEWENWADSRVRPVANWLIENSPATINSLSPEDWLAIAKMQQMKVDLIAWAFRDKYADAEDEDMPHYWKRFPALAKARKMDK